MNVIQSAVSIIVIIYYLFGIFCADITTVAASTDCGGGSHETSPRKNKMQPKFESSMDLDLC